MKRINTKTYKSLIDKAWDYYQKNKLDTAQVLCTKIISDYPNNVGAFYLSGHLAFDKEKYEDALKNFRKAEQNDKENRLLGFIYYWIGRTYQCHDIFGHSNNPVYNEEDALTAYKKSIIQSYFPPDSYLKILDKVKTDSERKKILLEAKSKFPENPIFYYLLAKFYKRLNKRNEELKILLEANNKASSAGIQFHIAEFFYEQKEYVKSREYYFSSLELIEELQQKTLLNYKIGTTYLHENNFALAESHFNKCETFRYEDVLFWPKIIGLIQVFTKQNKTADILLIFDSVELTEKNFIDGQISYLYWFDNDIDFELTPDFDIKNLITSILHFEKNAIELSSEAKIKAALLKHLLYTEANDETNGYKTIKECVKLLSYFNDCDFIKRKLIETHTHSIMYGSEDAYVLKKIKSFNEDLREIHLLSKHLFDYEIVEVIKKMHSLKQYFYVTDFAELLGKEHPKEVLFEIAYSYNEIKKTALAKTYYLKYIEHYNSQSAAYNNLAVIYEQEGDLEKAKDNFRLALSLDKDKELYKRNLERVEKVILKKQQLEKQKRIPDKWTLGIKEVNLINLDQIEYFHLLSKIDRVNIKFKALIERDLNELIINNLMQNLKATVVLSGSIVELSLIYFFEKKKINQIPYTDRKGIVKNKKLYDCVLSDLLDFAQSKNLFGKDFPHLGNLSRIYRNFIHPGLELKDNLNKPKADLCFLSALEIIKKVL